MGCLFALVAGVFPRLALLVVWLTTTLVDRAFEGFLLPLLGLIFLPLTTLVFVLAWTPGGGLGGGSWLWIALAFLLKLGGYARTGHTNRRPLRARLGLQWRRGPADALHLDLILGEEPVPSGRECQQALTEVLRGAGSTCSLGFCWAPPASV
jgi:hypothetical protein